ncbi:MAG: hypothetical protein NTV70_21180 [Acidobacteria bacterium]|nr:hypothetical protein [Acidobacteriota bacterium]
MRLVCINDRVPPETPGLLSTACRKRGVEYLELDALAFDFDPARICEPGDMLFRPAVSGAAMRVEQFVTAPDTATFYRDSMGCFFPPTGSQMLFARQGIDVPRFVYLHHAGRDFIRHWVEQLGGFPVVAKVGGWSRGVGVVRLDSMAGLFSFVDYALANGHQPMLMSFIADAEHWRVVVVGERAVAAYRNTTDTDDFRTYAEDRPEAFVEAPPEAVRLACQAVAAERLEFGGVDVLMHPSGRGYVLESNFPCYFAHAQLVAGIDIAGAMVEHLQEKARRLTA